MYQSNCPNRKVAARVLSSGSSGALCPFCRKPGHVEASCWTKFPQLRPGASNSSSSSISAASSQ